MNPMRGVQSVLTPSNSKVYWHVRLCYTYTNFQQIDVSDIH